MKSREVITYATFYKTSQKGKIESYSKKFPEKLINFAVNEFSMAIGIIIAHYNISSTAEQCIRVIPEIEKNLLHLSKEKIDSLKHNGYLYTKARVFIHKNEERIKEILHYKNISFPEDKKEEYLAILSDLSKDCVKVCLEKFEKEIEEFEKEEKDQKLTDKRLKKAEINKENLERISQKYYAGRKTRFFSQRQDGTSPSIVTRSKKRKRNEHQDKIKWVPDDQIKLVESYKDFNYNNSYRR